VYNAVRTEVLSDVDARLAAMTLPEHLKGTFNAGSYADAWRDCRKVVQELAGTPGTEPEEKATASAATATHRPAAETAPLTIYRAGHESIVMGLYTTRQAAYEHCEAHELRDDPVSPMSWKVDEDGVAELVRLRIPRSPGAESATGYLVTPLEVASEYDEEADE